MAKSQTDMHSIRDTVESVWVAIVLALVLRAFMVEAFVIPTGSMADRLMGEHWDLNCPACGYEYSYGWPGRAMARRLPPARGRKYPADGARCPRCEYPYPSDKTYRQYVNGGDRVLVMKHLLQFTELQPWDVVVFRNPQNNKENYIKRLVGLPGEEIEIVHGDIFFRRDGEDQWRIRRKTAKAQEGLWRVIFDSDHHPDAELVSQRNVSLRSGEKITPRFWRATDDSAAWAPDADDGRAVGFAGASQSHWLEFSASRTAFLPHYAYNTARFDGRAQGISRDIDVSSDLKLSGVFIPGDQPATLELMLTSFSHEFKAEFNTDGTVRLLYKNAAEAGDWLEKGKATVKPLEPGRGREVVLANMDLGVQVWLDGEKILELTDEYPENHETITKRIDAEGGFVMPTPSVRIGAVGGEFQLRHVRLMRDTHYTQPRLGDVPIGPEGRYARDLARRDSTIRAGAPGWGAMGRPIKLIRHKWADRDLDEFYVLGDNSPQSLDGRLWMKAAPSLRLYDDDGEPLYKLGTVPRYNLIGKALLVYWPAGYRAPGFPQWPLAPNVGRMRLIR